MALRSKLTVVRLLWTSLKALGTAVAGSDDKFSIVFTVHQDEFDAGKVNWICAKDSESEGAVEPLLASDVDDASRSKTSLSITPELREPPAMK